MGGSRPYIARLDTPPLVNDNLNVTQHYLKNSRFFPCFLCGSIAPTHPACLP